MYRQQPGKGRGMIASNIKKALRLKRGDKYNTEAAVLEIEAKKQIEREVKNWLKQDDIYVILFVNQQRLRISVLGIEAEREEQDQLEKDLSFKVWELVEEVGKRLTFKAFFKFEMVTF